MQQTIRLALAQISSQRENKAKNLETMEEVTALAKDQGAKLVIFPEMCLTGYVVKDQLYDLAETIPGPSTKKVQALARRTGMHIVFGMPELSKKTEATMHNTAVFIGPTGLIGTYHKMYLPTHSVFEEKRYFRQGYQPAVFNTPLGDIGLCICYDIFFPEVTRLIRLAGAKLIICISASPAVRRGYFEILTAARAIENTAYIAYVNLAGIEDGLQFWGGSRLVSPTGEIVAKAKYDEEDLLVCDIDFADLKPAEAFIPTLRDLRPELFEELKKHAELI